VKRISIACCTMLPILLAHPVHADPVTFQFSGLVTQVPVDEVFGDIAFGDTFDATLSFDSTATDLVPDDPTIGSYAFSSPFGMSVDIGKHNFEASGSLNIGILNSFVDQYTVLATSQTGDLDLELFLLDNTGSVFADDHLPVSLPPLASFTERDFHLDGFLDGGDIQVDGEIVSPSIQAVSEPSATIPLIVISVLASVLAYRRRFAIW
jgi:hypothetical protein